MEVDHQGSDGQPQHPLEHQQAQQIGIGGHVPEADESVPLQILHLDGEPGMLAGILAQSLRPDPCGMDTVVMIGFAQADLDLHSEVLVPAVVDLVGAENDWNKVLGNVLHQLCQLAWVLIILEELSPAHQCWHKIVQYFVMRLKPEVLDLCVLHTQFL